MIRRNAAAQGRKSVDARGVSGLAGDPAYPPKPERMPPLPLGRMYTLGIRCFFGRCHAAALLPEVVGLIEAGRLRPERVTTRVVEWDSAAEAWPEPAIKLVVRRHE